MIQRIRQYGFLFEELVKRDFKKKYKRTFLGVFWSMLSPLLQLLVMNVVFRNFFGRDTPHYTIYLFTGNLIYTFFRDATTQGMSALEANSGIFSKINVPKYMFLLSKNVAATINFLLTLVIYFIFVAVDGIPFTWKFFLLLFPIALIQVFNIGMGLILSALHMFFKDVQYLYGILTMVIMYTSAIFYTVDDFTASGQQLFFLNPVYCYITYCRQIVIYSVIPDLTLHLLCLVYAALALLTGGWMYKKYNYRFLYYI